MDTLEHLEDFRWGYLPAILASVVAYYVLKGIRWHFFLSRVGIALPLRISLLVYLSGQWFAFSPLGEFVKAYLLGRYGVDFRMASSTIVAQVLVDFLSLAVLGSVSLLWFPSLAFAVLPFCTLLFLAVALLHQRGFWMALDRWIRRVRLFGGREICLDDALHDARTLSNAKSLLIGLALGLPATLMGSLTLFLVALGHSAPVNMAQSTFVYSLSQLLGAMSMLPHGLGAVEGSALALFATTGLDDEGMAASIVALFRVASVVWGIGVGGLALLALPFLHASSRIRGPEPALEAQP